MQKKISVFIIITLFTLLNIKAQNIESIKGSTAVKANKEYSYSINFDKDLTSNVNVVVEISNGHFADNSSKKVFTFYSSFLGQKNYSVNIIWANSNFTNGTVSAYTVSNPSKVVKLEKIKHDENEGITKIYNLEMEGSNLL